MILILIPTPILVQVLIPMLMFTRVLSLIIVFIFILSNTDSSYMYTGANTNVDASTGPHIDTSTDIDTDLPIYTGHLHVGDVLRVFSRSTDDWVDGELVEFVEDNCVRVKYVVGKYWCRKTINLHSEHLRVPSGISNVCKNSSSSERKEKNRDHIRKHGQNV